MNAHETVRSHHAAGRDRRRKTPKAVAYDAAHPTFSARIPRALYDRLAQLRSFTGKSFASILAEALGAQEASAGHAADVAFDEAVRCYRVTYKCCMCGKGIALTSPTAKRAAGDFLEKDGWGHASCLRGREGGGPSR